MTAKRAAGGIAAMVVLAACGALGRRLSGGPPPQGYSNREAHFSFLVPRGWQEKRFRNPFRKSRDLVRFESSSGDAAAVAASTPLAGRSCLDAGRALLESVSGATLKSEETFSLKTAAVELPAAQARTGSDDRQGRVKLFCEGARVVVLEASAVKAAYAEREPELVAILGSFSYQGAGGETPVTAPKASASTAPPVQSQTPEPGLKAKESSATRAGKPRAAKRAAAEKKAAPAEGGKEAPALPAVMGPR